MADENRPSTEAELTRHLAQTLVQNEVLGPMDAIGWTFGTPPPAGRPDNPVPASEAPAAPATTAPVATTATPEGAQAKTNVPADADNIDWDALKDPNTGLYAGKYQTKADAVKGMGHVVGMAKDAFTRAGTLEQEVERLRSELASRQTQSAASPAAAPSSAQFSSASRAEAEAAQARLDKVLRDVAENGGVLDEDAVKQLQSGLREAVTVNARAAAEEALLSREGAKAKDDAEWKSVDDFMTKNYPQAEKFADEIGLFVQTNPLISKAVNALVASGDRVAAAEMAWKSFDAARGSIEHATTLAAAQTKEIQLEAADQVRKEAVDQSRIDAGIMASSAGGVHEVNRVVPTQSEIEAAAAGMRAYGMQPGNPAAAAWRKMVIPLDPKVFPDR